MKIGDKVRTPEGGIETIRELNGDLVSTNESSQTLTWYYRRDLIQVFYSENLKRYVTVPMD